MLRITLISVFFALSGNVSAQLVFNTLVKQGPIVAGEPFQVQYVLEDIGKDAEFYPPDFKYFRFISGPSIYEGTAYGTDGPKRMKNYIYTLEAIRPGKFIVKGATAKVDDRQIKSDDVVVEVVKQEISARKKSSDATYLLPDEDPYEKIRQNIFMKVIVDKNICFVGEPVTATFKLYSRLSSVSDIVKNPGFYGFSVQDMIGLKDRQSMIETVNGKKFDVHTIRKVQLYPLQAGEYEIDPMEVINSVEFSRSIVNKKPEQEIIEGVVDNFPGPVSKGTERFQSNMSSKSLPITVKPHPVKNKPTDFSGATGEFSIDVSVVKKQLGKNEEGELLVTISGRGNFPQLDAPAIKWPAGVEGFESKMADTIDYTQAPLKGKREFRFPFVSAKEGQYIIPAVSFSFFNPDTNRYKTLKTSPVALTIGHEEKSGAVLTGNTNEPVRKGAPVAWAIGITAVALIAGWFLWIVRRKRVKAIPVTSIEALPSVDQLLAPAAAVSMADDKTFYNSLRSCIWNFFSVYFSLSGSKMSRNYLQAAMQGKGIDKSDQQTILDIIQQCDTGIFTDATLEAADRNLLLSDTKNVLEKIKVVA